MLWMLQAVQVFASVDETADGANETLQEFIETLQNAAASSGLVTSLVHNLTQAVSRVDYYFIALLFIGQQKQYPVCKTGSWSFLF